MTAAATVLSSVLLEREFGAVLDWVDGSDEVPAEWREAAEVSVTLRYLTLDELRTWASRYSALLAECGFAERTSKRSARPAGTRPVKLMGFAFPLPPTPSGS